MKEKADQKDVGFLHHVDGGVKAIIEKSYMGSWHKNGCSIYLWANKQDDKNMLNQKLAVLAGIGFVKCTTQVEEEVKSFEEALAKIKAKPKEQKFCFYTYDAKAGTIAQYDAESKGQTSMKKSSDLITFFWAEEVDPNQEP